MRKLFNALLGLSLLGNAFLLYRVVDTGVTNTYQSSEIKQTQQQLQAVQKLWPSLMPNVSRERVLDAARKADLEVLDKQAEGIYVSGVHFIFQEDHVSTIAFD